ncbi:hypothetical protein BJX96DRAFT_149252 [Aspergillus floccosus]
MVRRPLVVICLRESPKPAVSRPVRCTVSQDRLLCEFSGQATCSFNSRLLILLLPCSSILLKCVLIRLTNVNLYL